MVSITHSFIIVPLLSWYCEALNYVLIKKALTPIARIPDKKWHFCKTNFGPPPLDKYTIVCDMTETTPLLRYCGGLRLFELPIKPNMPRSEVLALLQHEKGDHLVNLTVNDNVVYINGRKIHAIKKKGHLSLSRDEQLRVLPRLGKNHFSIGNDGDSRHPWVFTKPQNDKTARCNEVKLKVVGSVSLQFRYYFTYFATEPYDNTFYTPTTTLIPTTTTTTMPTTTTTAETTEITTPTPTNFISTTGESIIPEYEEDNETPPTDEPIANASSSSNIVYVICGVAFTVGIAIFVVMGFLLRRWYIKKRASGMAMLKKDPENVVSPNNNTATNTATTTVTLSNTSRLQNSAVKKLQETKFGEPK